MQPGKDFIGVGCGALIVNDKNETLLIKRTSKSRNEAGFWSKPGGLVDFGETVEDAIKREIKEELGIEIELADYLGYTDHIISAEKQHWVAINYSAKIVNGEPRIMEPEKIDEIRWFKFNDLPEKMTQTTRESVQVYLKTQNKDI